MNDSRMSEYGSNYDSGSGARFAATLLYLLSAGIAIMALIHAFSQMGSLGDQTTAAGRAPAATSAGAFSEILLHLLLGLGAAALLYGIAEVLKRVAILPETLRDLSPRSSGYALGTSQTGVGVDGAQQASLTEVAVLLRELRDISLLGEDERRMRLESQAEESAQDLEKAVPELLRSHNWVEARRRVQLARERFPSLHVWNALEQRINEVRESVEAQDIEAARRQVNDLAALGAWERAFDVVHDLLDRHPDSDPARKLAQRVKEERSKADAAQREQLMNQVQEAVKRRDWNTALSAANTMIRQYSESNEARALRLDLPTLTENAEIQTRKRMETEITHLSRSGRYPEAIELARNLIDRYPKSPQASVLREKLSEMEDRARAHAMS